MSEPAGMSVAVREMVDVIATESVAVLHDSMVGRILQPARWGGIALPADGFIAAICELAALDGSRGWLTAVLNTAAHEVAAMSTHLADELWGADPNTLITTGYRAVGRLTAGGRLTGRWECVVGAEYADWLLLTADRGGICRVLIPRSAVHLGPAGEPNGLAAAGIRDVTVSDAAVAKGHIFASPTDRVAMISAAGAAVAVVGTADGVWRRQVDQMRRRLATSGGGVAESASAQLARAASDIDAAKLQVTTSLEHYGDLRAATYAYRQAVIRARDAADGLLGSSHHALDAADPVTRQWRDVHAGYRLAVQQLPDDPAQRPGGTLGPYAGTPSDE